MEQSPSSKAKRSSARRNCPYFIDPEGSIPHSQGDIFYTGEKVCTTIVQTDFWLSTYLHRYIL
jgi:hypothetical protein